MVHEAPDASPQLVRDTLCVNKLYERAFLDKQAITFPEGRFTYEDFVFTARVLAAAPRIATIPDRVYVWHVRRSATRQSISLDRKDVANWQARIAAHRASVRIFQEAGQQALAQAARTKFLDHDLRMYVRELHTRGADYRAEWWRLTREYLAGFEEAELRAARAPARWLARVVLASPAPRDLGRLTQLAARPGRLLPPYAEAGGRAVWSGDLPEVELDAIGTKPMHRLPVTIDAELAAYSPGVLRLRVHDLYGRLAAAGPVSIDIELRRRMGRPARPGAHRRAHPGPGERRVGVLLDRRDRAGSRGAGGAGRSAPRRPRAVGSDGAGQLQGRGRFPGRAAGRRAGAAPPGAAQPPPCPAAGAAVCDDRRRAVTPGRVGSAQRVADRRAAAARLTAPDRSPALSVPEPRMALCLT